MLGYPIKYRSQNGTYLSMHWFAVPEQYIALIVFLILVSFSNKSKVIHRQIYWAWLLLEQALWIAQKALV